MVHFKSLYFLKVKLEKFLEDYLLLCVTGSPDDVGVVGLAELLEEGDLPEDGHGHAVLRQGQLHLHARVRGGGGNRSI